MAAEDVAAIGGMIKDARHDIIQDTENAADRLQNDITTQTTQLMDRFFAVGRDTSDLRAQVTALGYQVRDGHAALAKDAEINALKTQVEMGKQTTYLSDKIESDGEKTRSLINSLKEAELNRLLVERNTELVNAYADRRHWRHYADQGQWQALNSQLQAFQSQLQETRQGMVNFGTMAGVGQTSTSNNVR